MALFLIDIISFELAERPDNSQKESTNLSCVWILPVHSVICVYSVVYTIQQLLKWGWYRTEWRVKDCSNSCHSEGSMVSLSPLGLAEC